MRPALLFTLGVITLCGCAATPSGEGPTWTGYIYGDATQDPFDLIAPGDKVTVRFKVPEEPHFYVRVYGKAGNLLRDFDLREGDKIELCGGGKFSLEIYSRGDSGYWAATLIE
jgi:hypothetical protein